MSRVFQMFCVLTLVVLLTMQTGGFAAQTAAPTKPAAKKENCGCDPKPPIPEVVATVNGVKVLSKEIEDAIKPKIEELQSSVIEARKRELDIQINSRLLDIEAKKRNINTTKLIEQEIVSKVKAPSEAEAQAFYDQNKEKLQAQGTYAQLHDEILSYIQEQRQSLEAKKYSERLRAASQVKVLVAPNAVTAPDNDADRSRVLATVNGENITSEDIEKALRPLVFQAQEEMYKLRQAQLDTKINDILLEQEAQKRKTTAKDLLQAEVGAKVRKPTEAEAKKFYDENTEQIPGTFAETKEQLIKYLQQQEAQKLEDAFAETLKKNAKVEILLPEPDSPVYEISIADQPMKGNANAKVTVVEFTDYECPSCGNFQPVMEEIMKEYGDRVKFVIRDYPLTQLHAHAEKAAEAAEAAREQGKYWEYSALLFKNQKELEPEDLVKYAAQVGLDVPKFQQGLLSGKYAEKIQTDIQDGYKIGVNGTPTVFINGKRLRDRSKETLKAALDAALKSTN